MKPIKLIGLVVLVASALQFSAAPATSAWEKPAAAISDQIAEILGPAQARLTLRNLSTISNDEIPAIRRLVVGDLKAHGVTISGTESANEIRLTLSENQRERLWVAEVIEGNQRRVVMTSTAKIAEHAQRALDKLVLHKEALPFLHGFAGSMYNTAENPLLAVSEMHDKLLVLLRNEVVVFARGEAGWQEESTLAIDASRSTPRDPRGFLLPASDEEGFTVFVSGSACKVNFAVPAYADTPGNGWSIRCNASDDPWPILHAETGTIKAFYNTAHNYFTGVVSPSVGVELPPFYSMALLPRPSANEALLMNGIDGKVQLMENGAIKPVSGARDWGSDFATLHSGCGIGTQMIVSGSGEAITDSLRAYELPAQEAVPTSAALAVDGSVTALWSVPDGKSVFAIVRTASDEYEVDRVTATCN